MQHRGDVILLPANRVWRTYPGGKTLDALAGVEEPKDSHFAEDWIASVTAAKNAGRESVKEGVSRVRIGEGEFDLKAVVEGDPEYFLGKEHVAKFGAQPMLLVKFLDSAVRLHFQAHPTREFAQARLGANSGKTEAYHVLATRPEMKEAPYIMIGFQRPPAAAELKRMIEAQDIAAMERCFDRIPVKEGDTYLVPGGYPHALGPGVFLVEIQEPSDLVVRFEFEKAGYVLPEGARFMNRGVDFGIEVMDLAPHSAEHIQERCWCEPKRGSALAGNSWIDDLIGADRTPCFRVRKLHVNEPVRVKEASFRVCILTRGAATIQGHALKRSDKFAVPAGLGGLDIVPAERGVEILECLPPAGTVEPCSGQWS